MGHGGCLLLISYTITGKASGLRSNITPAYSQNGRSSCSTIGCSTVQVALVVDGGEALLTVGHRSSLWFVDLACCCYRPDGRKEEQPESVSLCGRHVCVGISGR